MASPIDADSASTQHSAGSKRAKQQVIEAADGPIWSQAGLSHNNWVPRFSVQAKQQVIEDADGCRSHLVATNSKRKPSLFAWDAIIITKFCH